MNAEKMKAVVCTGYGSADVLQVAMVDKPVPGSNEVLVRIYATTVNSGDVRVRGLVVGGVLRLVMRFVLGFTKPRRPILGTVLAGVVVAKGNDVTDFAVGNEVFAATGFRFGTYAQYATVRASSAIAQKPAKASFEEAAAIVFGGMTALYFLQQAGIAAKPGLRVLVYGATGSVGAAAVEIAKHYQAQVTAVCSEQGLPLVRELGPDTIIIYTQQDFTQSNEQYDIIFDAVGKTSRKACKGILAAGGQFITVGGLAVAKDTKALMEQLRTLYDSGAIRAHIDKTYLLDDIVAAHRYVDTGKKKGNVVVRIAQD